MTEAGASFPYESGSDDSIHRAVVSSVADPSTAADGLATPALARPRHKALTRDSPGAERAESGTRAPKLRRTFAFDCGTHCRLGSVACRRGFAQVPTGKARGGGGQGVTHRASVALDAADQPRKIVSGPRMRKNVVSAASWRGSFELCAGPLPPTRCGVCGISGRSAGANAPGSTDVVELDAASHGGVTHWPASCGRVRRAGPVTVPGIYRRRGAAHGDHCGLLKIVEKLPDHS